MTLSKQCRVSVQHQTFLIILDFAPLGSPTVIFLYNKDTLFRLSLRSLYFLLNGLIAKSCFHYKVYVLKFNIYPLLKTKSDNNNTFSKKKKNTCHSPNFFLLLQCYFSIWHINLQQEKPFVSLSKHKLGKDDSQKRREDNGESKIIRSRDTRRQKIYGPWHIPPFCREFCQSDLRNWPLTLHHGRED